MENFEDYTNSEGNFIIRVSDCSIKVFWSFTKNLSPYPPGSEELWHTHMSGYELNWVI